MDEGELFVKFDFDPTKITDDTRRGLIAAMAASTSAVANRAKGAVPVGSKTVKISDRAHVTISTSRKGKTKMRVKMVNGRTQKRLGDSILSGVREKDSGPIGFVNANERHSKVVEYGGVVGRSDPYPGKHPGRVHRKYQEHPYLIPAFESEKADFEARVSDVMDKAMAAASDKDDLI